MKRGGALLGLGLLVAACQGRASEESPPTAATTGTREAAPAHDAPAASTPGAGATRTFGRALQDGTQEVGLSELLAKPADYAGKTVRTSGTVARVCQKMGCWMELRVPDGQATLRAPMAGHAFFLPQDVVGQSAVVEGTVRVEALSEDQKAHYRSEGMEAVEVATSLDAQAVQVSGS